MSNDIIYSYLIIDHYIILSYLCIDGEKCNINVEYYFNHPEPPRPTYIYFYIPLNGPRPAPPPYISWRYDPKAPAPPPTAPAAAHPAGTQSPQSRGRDCNLAAHRGDGGGVSGEAATAAQDRVTGSSR